MAAISYSVLVGGNLQTVTSGTNAPAAGNGAIELRYDQTATAITDAAYAGGTRALKKGEVLQMIRVLEEAIIADTTTFQG
jgi:hypothetical protein